MYETDQTTLAAYLVHEGHPVKNVRWENGTCSFSFEDSADVNNDVDDFMRSEALVEPSQFYAAVQKVRRLMFTERDRNEARPA